MKAILIKILQSFLTEKVIKTVVLALGDYLVASSSNKLDDVLWHKVKKQLGD